MCIRDRKTDIQSWYLLMNCISQISSVSILGTSLQRSLRLWYVNESCLKELIKELSLAQQLSTTYQFLYSSLNFWKQNVKKYYEHIDELSNLAKEAILQNSRKANTAEEIQELAQILEFLIFDVQISTLNKQPTTSMYTRFCQLDDQLSTKFNSKSLPGQSTNIETYFLQKLQPKVKAKKHLPKQKVDATVPPSPTLGLRSRPEGLAQKQKSQPKSPSPDTQTLISSKFFHSWLKYTPHWFQSIHWSPQLLASLMLFFISMVLPIARRSKTFQILWSKSADKFTVLIKLVSTAMNALASL